MTVLSKYTEVWTLANGRHATPGFWMLWAGATEAQWEAATPDALAAWDPLFASPGILDAFGSDQSISKIEAQSFTVLDLGAVSAKYPYGRRNQAVSLAFSRNIGRDVVSASQPMPPQVAVCASIRTALAGRRHRGRCYFPAPAESSVDPDGRLSVGTMDDVAEHLDVTVDALSASYIASGLPATFALVVHSLAGTFVNSANRGVAVDTVALGLEPGQGGIVINPFACTVRDRKTPS